MITQEELENYYINLAQERLIERKKIMEEGLGLRAAISQNYNTTSVTLEQEWFNWASQMGIAFVEPEREFTILTGTKGMEYFNSLLETRVQEFKPIKRPITLENLYERE